MADAAEGGSPVGSENSVEPPRLCDVCGDKARGHNFGALSCESCKAFFRRAVLSRKRPRCPFATPGGCRMNVETRKLCPACRMTKCLAVGMQLDAVRSEETGLLRRKRPKPAEPKTSCTCRCKCGYFPKDAEIGQLVLPKSSPLAVSEAGEAAVGPEPLTSPMAPSHTSPSESGSGTEDAIAWSPSPAEVVPSTALAVPQPSDLPDDLAFVEPIKMFINWEASPRPPLALHLLTDLPDRRLLTDLTGRLPLSDSTAELTAVPEGTLSVGMASFVDLLNMGAEPTRIALRVFGQVHGFRQVHQADQTVLLRGSIQRLMCLYHMMTFDDATESSRSGRYFVQLRSFSPLTEVYTQILMFLWSFKAEWRKDERLMLLLMAVTALDPTIPGLQMPHRVAAAQADYRNLLGRYVRALYGGGQESERTLGELDQRLSCLPGLVQTFRRIFSYTPPEKLEPLIRDLYDIPSIQLASL